MKEEGAWDRVVRSFESHRDGADHTSAVGAQLEQSSCRVAVLGRRHRAGHLIGEDDDAQERVSQAFATHALRRSERRSATLSGWDSPLLEPKLGQRFAEEVT